MVLLRSKLAVVGDCATGKSSIIKMFTERTFPNQYAMTLGANIVNSRPILVPMDRSGYDTVAEPKEDQDLDIDVGNDEPVLQRKDAQKQEATDEVEFYIFDIGGSPIYDNSLDNINAFIIVYDVTNPDSFTNATRWYDRCKKKRVSPNNARVHNHVTLPGVLVANKSDRHDFSQVNASQGEAFAKTHNLEFFQIAASVDNGNVEQPFLYLADRLYAMYTERINMIRYMTEN